MRFKVVTTALIKLLFRRGLGKIWRNGWSYRSWRMVSKYYHNNLHTYISFFGDLNEITAVAPNQVTA